MHASQVIVEIVGAKIRALAPGQSTLVPVQGSRVAKVKVERLGEKLFQFSVPIWHQFNRFTRAETVPVLLTLVEFQKVYDIVTLTRWTAYPSNWWLVVVK